MKLCITSKNKNSFFLLSSNKKRKKIINDIISREQKHLEHMQYMHRRAQEIVAKCHIRLMNSYNEYDNAYKNIRHNDDDHHSSMITQTTPTF